MRRARAALAAAAAMLATAGALAESVRITARFPADYREASFLELIGVGPIDGRDGRGLVYSLERALQARGHFTVVTLGTARVDGIVSGLVTTEIDESRFNRQRDECVEKKDGKCVKTERIDETCRRRTIEVLADLRITNERSGRIVYSSRKPRRDEVSWCPNESAPGPVEGVIRGMIDDIAAEVARETAPHTETYAPRFYESRDAMDKELGDRFRAAIKATQRDLAGACAELTAMDQATPHFALAYDAGLCAEARGDYEAALAAYGRARDLRPRDAGDFNAGIERVRKLIVQRDDERAAAPR